MPGKTAPLLPPTERLLSALGERMRLARLRRRLPAKQVAQRAGMSLMTLRAIERGSASVTLGAYAAVLQTLQLETSLALLAADDPLGRQLQDKALPGAGTVRRARRAIPAPAAAPAADAVADRDATPPSSSGVSSDALLALLAPAPTTHAPPAPPVAGSGKRRRKG